MKFKLRYYTPQLLADAVHNESRSYQISPRLAAERLRRADYRRRLQYSTDGVNWRDVEEVIEEDGSDRVVSTPRIEF